MQRVLIESPYKADTAEGIEKNVEYLKACLRESCERGEAPLASHLFYTQFLDDTIPRERAIGIGAGLEWGVVAQKTIVYVDRGISNGMQFGIDAAKKCGRSIEYRRLGHGEPLATFRPEEITRVDIPAVRS